MHPNKFLNLIIGFVIFSVFAAAALLAARDHFPNYLVENTPEAVVNDYLVAILREDYQQAYSYLGEWPEKPDYKTFQSKVNGLTGFQYCIEINDFDRDFGIESYETIIYIETYHCDEEWRVDWETYEPYEYEKIGPNEALVQKVNGDWKLIRMPLPWWEKSWLPAVKE